MTPAKVSTLPIAKEILSYLLRNPEAADSFTELARWRLVQEAVRRSVENTQEALHWLVAEGYVSEEVRTGTESLFRLNPERRKDAESLLSEGSPNAEGQNRCCR